MLNTLPKQRESLPVRIDTFGKRLRLLRQDRGLSQLELRDRMERECGVSIGSAYISELEREKGMPTLPVAAAIAKVLDVSLDYLGLLNDDPSASYHRTNAPEYISAEADEVAQLVDRMHPSQREILLSVAKNMLAAPTPRQRERAEMRDILDSIERQHGREVRLQIEKLMRQKGFSFDSDT